MFRLASIVIFWVIQEMHRTQTSRVRITLSAFEVGIIHSCSNGRITLRYYFIFLRWLRWMKNITIITNHFLQKKIRNTCRYCPEGIRVWRFPNGPGTYLYPSNIVLPIDSNRDCIQIQTSNSNIYIYINFFLEICKDNTLFSNLKIVINCYIILHQYQKNIVNIHFLKI